MATRPIEFAPISRLEPEGRGTTDETLRGLTESETVRRARQLDVRILADSLLALEQGIGDEPDSDDAFRGFAVGLHAILVNVAGFVEPLAEVAFSAPDDEMGLAVVPGGQRAAVAGFDGERVRPVVREILTVVELDGDAHIVVRREGALFEVRRKFVHFPGPFEARVRREIEWGILLQDADVLFRVTVDGRIALDSLLVVINFRTAQKPQEIPAFGLWPGALKATAPRRRTENTRPGIRYFRLVKK